MDPWYYFDLATEAARRKDDNRAHRIGAVGIRADKVVVSASNSTEKHRQPAGHAEARLVRKLTRYSTVFVARCSDASGFLMARPCRNCLRSLRARSVSRVFYTISDTEYGVLHL